MPTNKIDKILYVPDEVLFPGETLQEALEERDMSQAEFAQRINRHPKTINEIIKGKAPITQEMALQFEQVLNIPASFWNTAESNHREMVARINARNRYKKLVDEARKYPYNEMAKNGWVENVKDPVDRVTNLLSFFGTTTFDNILEKRAFRVSVKQSQSLPAMTAWLRQGTIDGKTIETKEFDEKKLKSSLTDLRTLTLEEDPNDMMNKIGSILSECGVAFVLTKNIPKAPISGSTRRISSSKFLIQMSIKYSDSDRFWFSLFHEIGHILLGNKKDFSVDLKKDQPTEEIEKKSDKFAEDTLIPPETYEKFVSYLRKEDSYSIVYPACKKFAQQIEIHPGIVLGRLQNDEIIPRNMNKLKTRLKWAE